MAKRLSNEEFLERLAKVNPIVEALSPYVQKREKMKFRCKVCGNEWETRPDVVTTPDTRTGKTRGCPKCGLASSSQKQSMSNSEFSKRISQQIPTILLLSEYNGRCSLIRCKCKICGNETSISAESLLRSKFGCKYCREKSHNEKVRYTDKQFLDKMSTKRPDLIVLGEYQGTFKNIKVKSKICGHEWNGMVGNLWQSEIGMGCPICSGKTHDDIWFKEQMRNIHPNITVLGKYTTARNKVKLKCNICNNVWLATPSNLISRQTGCPHCNSSHGERKITDFLNKNNIIFEAQKSFDDCSVKRALKFDFYIPSKNLCIEYDGEQHYIPVDFSGNDNGEQCLKYNQKRDKIKDKYCKENNIDLLRIPYWEKDNIETILINKLTDSNLGGGLCAT